MAAVEVRDAFRIYPSDAGGTVALEGLDLEIETGEIVVALGPSGAGKSTLLRVLAGLESLSAGQARVFGTDLGRLDRAGAAAFRAAHVGLLDQHYARALSPDLTCRHTVALQLDLLGAAPDDSRAVADGLLDRVGLLDRRDDPPTHLSGGEQQRVAVCAAVAHRPRLLLADEPAGELDAANAATVYALLGSLVRDTGATALIVSHDPAAAAIADRLVSIRDGRIVEEARPGHSPVLVISRRGWARLPNLPAGEGPRYAEVTREDARIVLTTLPPEGADNRQPEGRARRDGPPATAEEVGAQLTEVTKRYATPTGERVVLDGLSHLFLAGVMTGLIGRSGSGKTTLLHILAGLERPTSGRVAVAGCDLTGMARGELADLRRREIALVTQEPGLVPYLTALENVELGLSLRAADPPPARARAALAEVGLDERRHHRAADLSAGERERVAIARALATRARILLIDEPTARLDQENGRTIGRLLADSARQHGLTVICATHDPTLVELMDESIELGERGPDGARGSSS